jgi:hypothetical protein
MEAAEFLGLLVTGRVNNRSWYGAAQLDDAEIAQLVAGGVRIFLHAYRPPPSAAKAQPAGAAGIGEEQATRPAAKQRKTSPPSDD